MPLQNVNCHDCVRHQRVPTGVSGGAWRSFWASSQSTLSLFSLSVQPRDAQSPGSRVWMHKAKCECRCITNLGLIRNLVNPHIWALSKWPSNDTGFSHLYAQPKHFSKGIGSTSFGGWWYLSLPNREGISCDKWLSAETTALGYFEKPQHGKA